MSGEQQALKNTFIPAPTGGLNLRLSPYQVATNEAVQLDNYLVYDWGIREAGAFTTLTQPAVGAQGQLIYFKNNSGTALQLICVANKVYLVNNASWTTPTNMTGALTITSDAWRFCFFKKRIFLVNATNVGLVYDIAAGTLAADSWTGTTSDNFSQVWTYKQRVYFIKKNSTIFGYGPVSSIAGAIVEYDVGEFLEDYGNLLFGTSWSVNQGNTNEQLQVLVTDSGEVLVYSGDNPTAANWSIVNRVTIPTPLGNQAFVRLGQDVLISTVRGVISLAAVIAGRGDEEGYFNKSIKLADAFGSVNIRPARDPRQPFIYFASSSSQYIYVLNFELGAWSRIDTGVNSSTITAMSFYDNGVTGNYLNVSYASGVSKLLDDTAGNSVIHVWRSGFLPVEPEKQKQIKMLRVVGRNISGTANFKNTVSIQMDSLNGTPTSDSRTTDISAFSPSVTGYNYVEHELSPANIGKRPSVAFSKTSAGEQNEIVGFDLFYETGGAY